MSSERLTPTSYVVLGLLGREGPSTPYELKRHVGATLGNFWSFPHTLLYSEPARLAGLGLVTESPEQDGRRRRVFTITEAGLHALQAWLDRPHDEPTQLRDLGLLRLFFADLAPPTTRLRVAEQQLAIHQARLSAYEEDARLERRPGVSGRGQRTVEHWRGETLRMGLLYERAAVEFWEDIARAKGPIDQPQLQAAGPDAGATSEVTNRLRGCRARAGRRTGPAQRGWSREQPRR